MLKNRGIAFKLTVFLIAFSALILLVIFGCNYYFSRQLVESNVDRNARTLVESAVNRIDAVLLPVQKVPESIAAVLEQNTICKQELFDLLRRIIEQNPGIYGIGAIFEPYAFEKESLYFAPYVYRHEGKIESEMLGGESYPYFYYDWYQIPKELQQPQWSEPYYDLGGGNIIMATYSVPFYRTVDGQRKFMGVIGADISLEGLSKIVSSIKILRTGDGFLISRSGAFVTHKSPDLIMNETIFSIAEARNDSNLREVGRRMINGLSGSARYTSITTGKPSFIYYAPVKSSGWSVAVVFPQVEFAEDINRISTVVILLGVFGLLLLSFAVLIIAGTITNPLREMVHVAEKIGAGDFDVELPLQARGDEVGKLATALDRMRGSLKDYIARLTETTATKERIENELKIAHDIQMGILPKIFPPFPNREEFDIFAVIKPAKEVGGDFYDFFEMDDEHICFVIGDVSGKGVPASLFMAVTKTLIKATAAHRTSPGEILSEVNRELSTDNDSAMFVTIFLGVLNTATGEVTYANGGHNPPLLMSGTGEFSFIEAPPGLVVGAMEDFVYSTQTVSLQKGDAVFLYTDGVTEAMDEKGELFSETRLIEYLSALRGVTIKELVSGMVEEISAYEGQMPQSDDITMMVVQFRGK
ncbi:MAG: SpoIIE family protein phosphatase [Syntrophobacteraceae bacterium]|jgi:sigma-B regulation protein RsbU (phosphoserine phosphatase)